MPASPRFTVCHAIQGRLRVKVFQIKGSEDRAQALKYRLAGQTEVQEASTSAITGGMVLLYDAAIKSFKSTHGGEEV